MTEGQTAGYGAADGQTAGHRVPTSAFGPRPGVGRRAVLRGALAVGAGFGITGLAGCATSGSGGGGGGGGGGASPAATGSSGASPASADNPLGIKPDSPLEVVIFDGGYGHAYAQTDAELYQGKYSKAKVTVTPTQQIQQTLQPRFAGGTPPDVVDNSGANLMDFGALSSAGQLAAMEDLLDAPSWDIPGKKVRDTLYPGVVPSGTLKDKMEILNYVYTVYGFWYSKSAFAKQGWEAPTTWDEFMALSKKIKATGQAPFTYQGKYPYYIYEPMLAMAAKAGGSKILLDIDNLAPNAWTAPEVVAAGEAIREIVAKGYLLKGSQGLSHTESQTAWTQGKAAFIPCGNWLSNEMKAITPSGFDMVVFPTPSLSTGDKMPATALHASPGEGFIVAAQGKNPRGGLEFLRAMLSQQASKEFTKANAALTVVQGAADGVDGGTALSSANAVVKAAGDNTLNWYFGNWYGEMAKKVEDATSALMNLDVDAKGWAQRCQQAADATAKDKKVTKFTRSA